MHTSSRHCRGWEYHGTRVFLSSVVCTDDRLISRPVSLRDAQHFVAHTAAEAVTLHVARQEGFGAGPPLNRHLSAVFSGERCSMDQ